MIDLANVEAVIRAAIDQADGDLDQLDELHTLLKECMVDCENAMVDADDGGQDPHDYEEVGINFID